MPPARPLRGVSAFAIRCLLLVVSLAAALSGTPGRALATREVQVTVSAAASLAGVLQEVKALYLKEHPEVDLALNLGGSGTLQVQIEHGAPVDVFAAAGMGPMQKLVDLGVVDRDAIRVFARNRLVLIVPQGSSAGIRGISDLTRPEIRRIAVGDAATVPAGTYAVQALRRLGLFEAVKGKLIPAADVRQVFQYVASGSVDAGILYVTDVPREVGSASEEPAVRIVEEIPASAHEPIVYPAAVLRSSEHPKEAAAFLRLLLGPEGRAILLARGFELPAEAQRRP